MKRITFMVAFFAVLVISACGSEPVFAARKSTYIIGISPYLDNTVKNDVYRRIAGFVLNEMPANSSLSLYDAYNLKTIAQLEVPDARAFQSSKTRANQFGEQVLKLKNFLASAHDKPQKPGLDLSSAIRLPQFIDFVAEHFPQTNRVVILLGSPLYIDHKEPSFSMVDGYFPSDGHLLATRDQTVFAVKDRRDALSGAVVHIGWFGDPWVSDVHREKVARFWTLFLKEQGAQLATFCGDLVTLFNATRNAPSELSVGRFELDRSQKKIEMLRITRDVNLADWITRESLPRTEQGPPSKTIGPMKIGIRWRGNIDLDLYAAAQPGGERLYFEHTRNSLGYYFKDHRSSPDREYEFIEFESPVDVTQVEAAINFYKGDSDKHPTGEIRIEFEGKIYSGKFAIEASHGNQGREGDAQTEFWARIDVPRILKLPASTAALAP